MARNAKFPAGALFPVGDAPALARAAAALLDDPARRAALAARGTEVVKTYDWPVVAERVMEVYSAAIEVAGATVQESVP